MKVQEKEYTKEKKHTHEDGRTEEQKLQFKEGDREI